MNDLLLALLEVPPVDVAVRWPDPPDLRAEVMSSALLASPLAARQYVAALHVALDRADTLDAVVTELYAAGAVFGQHGASEAAGLLWALADAIRASLDTEGGDR
jgi:hypothetical protein